MAKVIYWDPHGILLNSEKSVMMWVASIPHYINYGLCNLDLRFKAKTCVQAICPKDLGFLYDLLCLQRYTHLETKNK